MLEHRITYVVEFSSAVVGKVLRFELLPPDAYCVRAVIAIATWLSVCLPR